MFCPYCGMEIENNSKFCPFCGEHLDDVPAPVAPAPEEPVPEMTEEPAPAVLRPDPEAWQPQAPAPEFTPDAEPQPVRFDQTNTYQYRQEYTSENPYNGQPAPAQNEKPGKGNKKTLLWILLGAAAALLVAGAIILVIALSGGSSKRSTSRFGFMTKDNGLYIDDEKGMLFEEASDYYVPDSLDKAVISQKAGKWYFVKNGNETRIGNGSIKIITYAQKDLSWVIYENQDYEFVLFRDGKDEVILEEGVSTSSLNTYNVSNNERYMAYVWQVPNKASRKIVLADLSAGETKVVYESKEGIILGVDDEGLVYIREGNECFFTSGEKETDLEDVTNTVILKNVILCGVKSGKKVEFYTRKPGAKAELVPLADTVDEDILTGFLNNSAYRYLIKYRGEYGYVPSKFMQREMGYVQDEMLLEYDGDIYLLDLNSRKAIIFMENASIREILAVIMEDKKTAYVQVDGYLYKLTKGKEAWEKERISRRCDYYEVKPEGIVYVEDDSVFVYNGKESVEMAECADYVFAVSEDLKTLAYLDDGKVMYVSEPGKNAERLARDAQDGDDSLVIFNGYVYYINEDDELVRIRPGKEPEVIMEDVDYIGVFNF